jgi:hypothetical protein
VHRPDMTAADPPDRLVQPVPGFGNLNRENLVQRSDGSGLAAPLAASRHRDRDGRRGQIDSGPRRPIPGPRAERRAAAAVDRAVRAAPVGEAM